MERIRAIFAYIFNVIFRVRYCERCGRSIWTKDLTRCPRCDFRMRDANEKSWGLFALSMIPVIGVIVGIIAAIVCAIKGKPRKASSAISGVFAGLGVLAVAAVLFALGSGMIAL